ncbi:MAG TPA: ligand-binding protein, partial [Spirochaetales bacterium]|nr:ligand-binding protein [Spirochaetales bacterium]
LLPGEQLQRLVEYYADGFTEKANQERLSVINAADSAGTDTVLGYRRYLSYREGDDGELAHLDTVLVPSVEELKPVAWFEGAIGQEAQGVGVSIEGSKRVPYTFVPGELLSSATRVLAPLFSGVSDLEHAYIQRGTERVAVDLAKFLYEKDFSQDYQLVSGDVVVIPFRQLFVTVSGAVKTPGRYPYIPDRTWDYYIALAGGFDIERNSGQALRISDLAHKSHGKDRIIQPEDIIEAKSNNLLYGFGRVSGIIGTIVSVASLVLSIYNMTK